MTADDALREEIARALHRHATDDGEVHTLWGGESEHEEEVAEWLPFADTLLPIVARVEREAYQRGQVEALREAAEGLRAGVRGSKCNPGCHEADQITLRLRADSIVREAQP